MNLFLFDFVVSILLFIDYKLIYKRFSPVFIISAIYILLINVNNLFAHYVYKYYLISNDTLLVLFLYFFLIFAISIFYGICSNGIRNKKYAPIYKRKSVRFINVLFLVGLCAYFLSLVRNISLYGFGNIKGRNDGLLGHISSFSSIFLPIFFISMKKRHKIVAYSSLIMQVGISFLFGGKYVIFLNLIYFIVFITLFYHKSNKILTRGIIFGIFGILSFILIYAIIPNIVGNTSSNNLLNDILFSVEHFFYYLLSPIIANNHSLNNVLPNSTNIPFTVFINIFKALNGEGNYVFPVLNFDFEYKLNSFTNVSGLFGELHYTLGSFKSIIYIFVLFNIIYIFYITTILNNRYMLTTSYFLAIMSFSFFSNFFTVSGVILPLLFLFVFETIFQLRKVKRREEL